MQTIPVQSHADLIDKIQPISRALLLVMKSGSEQSDCALKNIEQALHHTKPLPVFVADVNYVRDIHTVYEIQTAPTLLEFEKGQLKNLVKGCHSPDFYISLFNQSLYSPPQEDKGTPQKTVKVYTTPSCSWCTTLKNHLRKHGISFYETDVSTDVSAAEEMTRKSGQRGVPQTEIDGEMIVGFDKTRINKLLNIQP